VAALAWWALPIGATVLAVLWMKVAGRRPPPADTHETIADYARFRAALSTARDPQAARDARPERRTRGT
jgi:hypothetical protein